MSQHTKKQTLALMTRTQLAEAFGKNARTIAKWLEDGLPVAVKGRGGRPSRYSLPACVQWVIDREVQARGGSEAEGIPSAQHERALLDRIRRKEVELKMAVRRGELLDAEDVTRAYADVAIAVKARLRAIPDGVADVVAAAARNGGPAAVKALLRQRIDDALRALAKGADIPPAAVTGDDPDDHGQALEVHA